MTFFRCPVENPVEDPELVEGSLAEGSLAEGNEVKHPQTSLGVAPGVVFKKYMALFRVA